MHRLDKSIGFNLTMALSGVVIVLTGIFIEETLNIAWASLASLAVSVVFIIIATNIFRQKNPRNSQMTHKSLTSLLYNTYTPDGFSRQHLVAIIGGVIIGAFMTGMVIGTPESGQPWWPTVAATLIGALVGAFFVLNLVGATKRSSK